MSIGAIIRAVPQLKKIQGASNDDFVDRLNHVWTVFIFAMFTFFVTATQLVGEPIRCWCPAEFIIAQSDYAKSYCWVQNTYYISMDEQIPIDVVKREEEELSYYPWVPLILLLQAFMFKFPNIVWRLFNGGSGLSLDKVVEMACKTQMGSPDERDKNIDHITKYLDRWLETHRVYHWNMFVRVKQRLSRVCCFFCNKRAGTYLTAFYLFTKGLYVANVIAQFFILNAFLATDYNLYGFEVLANLRSETVWKESPRFPRVTLCDLRIRQLQNLQTMTVQCVLPINLFNEKIFIFIWFWLVLVATVTCLSFVLWMYRIVFKRNRASYTRKYLKINNEIRTDFDRRLGATFADDFLRDDGVFVLRVISKNSTDIVVTDLVSKLWNLYKKKSSPTQRDNDVDEVDSNLGSEDKDREPLTDQ